MSWRNHRHGKCWTRTRRPRTYDQPAGLGMVGGDGGDAGACEAVASTRIEAFNQSLHAPRRQSVSSTAEEIPNPEASSTTRRALILRAALELLLRQGPGQHDWALGNPILRVRGWITPCGGKPGRWPKEGLISVRGTWLSAQEQGPGPENVSSEATEDHDAHSSRRRRKGSDLGLAIRLLVASLNP